MYVKPLGTHVNHYINFTPNSIIKQTKTHKLALVTTNYTYNTTKPQRIYFIEPSDPATLNVSYFTYR